MNKLSTKNWGHYIETPQKVSAPVKIDEILQKRMKEFMKARKLRGYCGTQN